MEQDLIMFGIANHVFAPDQIVNLLYGSLRYSRHKAVKTEQEEGFCEWNAYPRSLENWNFIPIEKRREILTLLMKTIKDDCFSRFDCFHTRILCLLHYLLDDEDNVVECTVNRPWGQDTVNERKYSAFFSMNQERVATSEMFLWYKIGLRKTEEERRLLKLVWKKFLGCDDIRSPKRLKYLVEREIDDLKVGYKIATHQVKYNDALIKRYNTERKAIKKRHFAKAKKETLLHQLEVKDSNAHRRFWQGQGRQSRCMLALNFLNGYLDFCKATSK